MARFYCFLSRGFIALAVVFLVLANFAAPELLAESSTSLILCNTSDQCPKSNTCSGLCLPRVDWYCQCFTSDKGIPPDTGTCGCGARKPA